MEFDPKAAQRDAFLSSLMGWYDWSARALPWRVPPGVEADPYKVWLSEIMLQQTTVKTVIPYYKAFIRRWPDVAALAAAELDDILRMWAGLGYYSRARNLHKCARAVMEHYGGRFPAAEDELLKLPGIGAYTAAAIAAIAFGRRATVVDGNVERVIARLFALEEPLPRVRPRLRALAERLTPELRPGDYAQAMMDLGATICTPRSPGCLICPVAAHCAARARGMADRLPRREAARQKPLRHGMAFFVLRSDGSVLLRRRAEQGLLGGMMEVPTSAWTEGAALPEQALAQAPLALRWTRLQEPVRHIFTHFRLELTVCCGMAQMKDELLPAARPECCIWVARQQLHEQALPSLMSKVVAHALESGMGGGGAVAPPVSSR
ncbi:MAG: A/G-specific adenine glycosylase [Methyloligellaceae bacterium]